MDDEQAFLSSQSQKISLAVRRTYATEVSRISLVNNISQHSLERDTKAKAQNTVSSTRLRSPTRFPNASQLLLLWSVKGFSESHTPPAVRRPFRESCAGTITHTDPHAAHTFPEPDSDTHTHTHARARTRVGCPDGSAQGEEGCSDIFPAISETFTRA
ncbi:unnamed protein product [Leuciscus chuanchicus]